jgi:ubiquinone/menaquinone biosynthesis C-methylase UbiE
MNPAEYERMFHNEDHYWWFVSRRELVVEMVGRLPLPRASRIVDVGCGSGATAAALHRFGAVTGVDMSPLALDYCRRRGLDRLMQGMAEALPLADVSADVIVATDILEHLDDDLAALREFRRVLRPGGYAVITVPAYRMLWSEHDEALMHRRRYVAGQLGRRVAEAGFETVKLSYALAFLLPLALSRLLRRRPRPGKVPEAQVLPVPAQLNAALIGFQRIETALLRRASLPFGLSVLAVIRKPEDGPPADPARIGRPASLRQGAAKPQCGASR